MTNMKPEIKQLWTDALRSGKYNQSTGTLQDSDGFCCLGVLTQLYVDKHPEEMKTEPDEWGNTRYITVNNSDEEPETSVLPKIVADWAGLSDRNPSLTGILVYEENEDDYLGTEETLPASEWNDDYGKSFGELANMIENSL